MRSRGCQLLPHTDVLFMHEVGRGTVCNALSSITSTSGTAVELLNDYAVVTGYGIIQHAHYASVARICTPIIFISQLHSAGFSSNRQLITMFYSIT